MPTCACCSFTVPGRCSAAPPSRPGLTACGPGYWPCAAAPITFIHEGIGSGTLNDVPFPSTSFIITADGDTANRGGGNIYIIKQD